ncbi:MAG: Bicyclomycin resistance protein [Alphaproteobacteria bacterium MarineAlpha2_Bin1]|nr:MAG: Bicyclomycin resistance protein [Alphaproteobacteria bacterium MarineAlpha2_Bin1]|tara:strand:- start:498 stop:1700 length:1203 start_codon:yes stop_codon:yes gene_type:complete
MTESKEDKKKVALLVILLSGLMVVAYSSIGIYTPAMPAIADYFDITSTEVQLTFSIYILAFAFGQLIYGPLSDRYGRRPAIFLGLFIYVIGSILATFSSSIEVLIFARGLQGLGGCSGPVVGRAILRDLFNRERSAIILSYVSMVMGAAPAFAPLIGGYLQVSYNWQSIFLFLIVIGLIVLISNLLYLKESNASKAEGNGFDLTNYLNNYFIFMKSRIFIGYSLTASFAMSMVFVYSSGAPFILISLLGIAPDVYGWYILLPTFTNFIGAYFAARLLPTYGVDKLIFFGSLVVMICGGLMSILSLFLQLSVWIIILPMCGVMFGLSILYPSSAQGAVSVFPNKAGAASSLNGFLHMFIASGMVLFVGFLFNGTQWPLILLILFNGFMTFLSLILFIFRKN